MKVSIFVILFWFGIFFLSIWIYVFDDETVSSPHHHNINYEYFHAKNLQCTVFNDNGEISSILIEEISSDSPSGYIDLKKVIFHTRFDSTLLFHRLFREFNYSLSAMPLPEKKEIVDLPLIIYKRKQSNLNRKIRIQYLQVHAKDTDINIDKLTISPGQIIFLNTALFKAVIILNLHMLFHSRNGYRSLDANQGKWIFPAGQLLLENGKIVDADNEITKFDFCEVEPSSLKIIRIVKQSDQVAESENKIQRPIFFGIQSKLFPPRKANPQIQSVSKSE